MGNVYSKMAQYYDKLYANKDYAGEVDQLLSILKIDPVQKNDYSLLDIACGSGLHLEYLSKHFQSEGLDVSPELIEIARQRIPDIEFHLGNMMAFDLGKRFYFITCLFSSIGYVRTLENLEKAAKCMFNHLNSQGVLIIEPWFTPGEWQSNTVHALHVDEPELKISRINTSLTEGRISVLDLHHLIGTPDGTEHFVEHHELGLFEIEETISVLNGSGFEVRYDNHGLTGRGLYLCRKKKGF